jgi:AcrR family transcriptional regulator
MTEERRREILEAAGAVIAERGLCDARISDVARRVGTSPALILYYFPSKDRLLSETLAFWDRQFFDEVSARLAGLESAAERLGALIDASCPAERATSTTRDDWLLWPAMWTRARFDADLAAERERLDARFRSTIAAVVEGGVASGEFSALDASAFAIHLSALIDGLAIQVMLGDRDVDAKLMRNLCHEFATTALGAAI